MARDTVTKAGFEVNRACFPVAFIFLIFVILCVRGLAIFRRDPEQLIVSGELSRKDGMEERRRHKRFSVDILEISGKMVLARYVKILDISIGGVSFKADRRLHIGHE